MSSSSAHGYHGQPQAEPLPVLTLWMMSPEMCGSGWPHHCGERKKKKNHIVWHGKTELLIFYWATQWYIDHKFSLYSLGNQHHFSVKSVFIWMCVCIYCHFWVDTWKCMVLCPTDAHASVRSRWFLGCLLPKHTSYTQRCYIYICPLHFDFFLPKTANQHIQTF